MLCRLVFLGMVLLIAGLNLMVPCEITNAGEPAVTPLRAGIIGLDTSHVTAFTQLLNDPHPRAEFAGVRVVAGYPGGSPDIASSRDRIAGFTKALHEKYGVEIVGSIDDLLKKVDVVLLESVDGRPHLAQARPVFQSRKPVFIDKPVAGTLADAIAIFELARESGTPCFSSSSLRFSAGVVGMKKNPKLGDVIGCDAYGPCHLEEHHPDLYWYGVHGVESLFTIMGTGCQSVARIQTEGTDLAAGVWNGGRIGTFRGLRQSPAEYGATVFGSKGIVTGGSDVGYEPLLVEVCKFFRTGKPPVSAEQTIEIFAFMEAADESKRQGGKPVTLETVMSKAKAELATRGSR